MTNRNSSRWQPGRKEQSPYSQAHLLWLGIPLFMMHLGSRRQLRLERLGEHFDRNLVGHDPDAGQRVAYP